MNRLNLSQPAKSTTQVIRLRQPHKKKIKKNYEVQFQNNLMLKDET
jgi:hypothetical protein